MAIIKIKPTKMNNFNEEYTTPVGAVVGADGAEIDFSGKDFKVLVSVTEGTATFKSGDGIQGVRDLTVAAGKSVVLESGAFKFVTGAHKGNVFVTGATAKIAAIELP